MTFLVAVRCISEGRWVSLLSLVQFWLYNVRSLEVCYLWAVNKFVSCSIRLDENAVNDFMEAEGGFGSG